MMDTIPRSYEQDEPSIENLGERLSTLAETLLPSEGYEVTLRGIALPPVKAYELGQLLSIKTSLEHIVDDNSDTEITLGYDSIHEKMYLRRLHITDAFGKSYDIFNPQSGSLRNAYVKLPVDQEGFVDFQDSIYPAHIGRDILDLFCIDSQPVHTDIFAYQSWLATILDRAGDTKGWTVREIQPVVDFPDTDQAGTVVSNRSLVLERKRETFPTQSSTVALVDSITIFGENPVDDQTTRLCYDFCSDRETGESATVRLEKYTGDPSLYVDYRDTVGRSGLHDESQLHDLRKLVEITEQSIRARD